MPDDILCPPGLCADIIVRQDAPRGQEQRKARASLFVGRHIISHDELALSTHKAVNVHDRRTVRVRRVDRPLQRTFLIEPIKADARKGRREPRHFIHDLGRVGVGPVQTHRLCEPLGDFPVFQSVERRHHLADRLDAPFGIGEGAIFLKKGRAGQEDMRVVGRLVEEEILDDHALHRRQPCRDVPGVGIGLEDILALNVECLEHAIDRGVEHVGDAQTRFGIERDAPVSLEQRPCLAIGDVAIARQFVREAAHVTCALDIVLAAQGIHANAAPSDIAGRHRKVGNRHHR